jgi:hypothetical protein
MSISYAQINKSPSPAPRLRRHAAAARTPEANADDRETP